MTKKEKKNHVFIQAGGYFLFVVFDISILSNIAYEIQFISSLVVYQYLNTSQIVI